MDCLLHGLLGKLNALRMQKRLLLDQLPEFKLDKNPGQLHALSTIESTGSLSTASSEESLSPPSPLSTAINDLNHGPAHAGSQDTTETLAMNRATKNTAEKTTAKVAQDNSAAIALTLAKNPSCKKVAHSFFYQDVVVKEVDTKALNQTEQVELAKSLTRTLVADLNKLFKSVAANTSSCAEQARHTASKNDDFTPNIIVSV